MVFARPGEDPENREQTALVRGAVLHEEVGQKGERMARFEYKKQFQGQS